MILLFGKGQNHQNTGESQISPGLIFLLEFKSFILSGFQELYTIYLPGQEEYKIPDNS